MARSPAQGDLFPPEPGCGEVVFVNGRCQFRREGAERVVLVSGFPVAHFTGGGFQTRPYTEGAG